jgi:transposase
VVAAVAGGLSQQRAAQVFGISRSSVGMWVRAHRREGPQALDAHRRGRSPGEQYALSRLQQAELLADLAGGAPDDYGVRALLWSRRSVAEHIKIRFGSRLSVTTVGLYLARWGLSPTCVSLPAATASLGRQEPRPARPPQECVRIAWSRPVPRFAGKPLMPEVGSLPTGPMPGAAGPHEYLDVMVALSSKGMFFLCLRRPIAVSGLTDFGRRASETLHRPVLLAVQDWPAGQSELLRSWCASPEPAFQVAIGSAVGRRAKGTDGARPKRADSALHGTSIESSAKSAPAAPPAPRASTIPTVAGPPVGVAPREESGM